MQTLSIPSNALETAIMNRASTGVPDHLGKYRIEGVLGEGGMGVVYKGYDADIARTVAIKTVRRSLLEGQAGQELLKRFRREVRAEGRMLHNNIVTVYEFGQDEQGAPFFVMEYVQGQSIKELLTNGASFDLKKTVNVIKQVLSALDYSHKLGVIHRDIKPANIMLLENGTVKLADFGIALIDDTESTQTGLLMGTPQYMSPEQCLGGVIDSRSDIYSVGVVLYELVTGVKAFPNISASSIGRKLKGEIPAKPDKALPETIKLFEKIIVKALAKEPNDRFQTAQEFIDSMESITGNSTASFPSDSNRKRKIAWVLGGNVMGIITVIALFFLFFLPKTDANLQTTESPQKLDSVASIPHTPISPEQAKRVGRLLRVANSHMMIGRLVSPDGSNAYYTYRMVLDTDPGNTEAKQGLKKVQSRILERSERMLINGEIQPLKEQLDIALRLFPENQNFRQLKSKIN